MRIEIQPLGDADLPKLARLTYHVRHHSPLKNKAQTVGRVVKAFRDLVSRESGNIAIQAKDDTSGSLLGWLNLYTGIPSMVFIGRWHPIVSEGRRRAAVARSLIQEAKSQTAIMGRRRLEIQLDEITPRHRPLLRTFSKWYSSEGFRKASEEYYMQATLEAAKLEGYELPNGFSLHPLIEVGNEEIRDCFLKTFRDSYDRLFLSMNTEQQHVTFEECFRRSESLDQEHSYCVRKGGQVIAFELIEKEKERHLVEFFGVHPKYRGRGLGGALLAQSLRSLLSIGVVKVDIETDVTNIPAIRLYRRLGFVPLHRQAYYYWNLE